MPTTPVSTPSRFRSRAPEAGGFAGAMIGILVVVLVVATAPGPKPAPVVLSCTLDSAKLPPLPSANATLTYVSGSGPELPYQGFTQANATATFKLVVNETTTQALPGVNATFTVTPVSMPPPQAGGSPCLLPLPSSSWSATPSPLTLSPGENATVTFIGVPDAPYDQAGAFAVEVQDIQEKPTGLGGATYVYLTVR